MLGDVRGAGVFDLLQVLNTGHTVTIIDHPREHSRAANHPPGTGRSFSRSRVGGRRCTWSSRTISLRQNYESSDRGAVVAIERRADGKASRVNRYFETAEEIA